MGTHIHKGGCKQRPHGHKIWLMTFSFCLLPHPPSVCCMMAKQPQPHYCQQYTSPTYYQKNRSFGKQSYFSNLVCRRPHPNFTTTDHCSGLSITSGVPSCRRAFERAHSRCLITYAVFSTTGMIRCTDHVMLSICFNVMGVKT